MIQRELQVVRLQYDFPGEWTFEGDFDWGFSFFLLKKRTT